MACFYGWTHEEINNLPINTLWEYWEAITVIEAQEMLKDFKVSSYPNFKENDQAKLQRSLRKVAYPESQEAMENKDLLKHFKRLRNGG